MAGRTINTSGVANLAGYRVSTVTSAYRTAVSSLDTADLTHADIQALASIECQGYQNIEVAAHHSASGATIGVSLVRFYKDSAGVLTPKSMSTTTLTAGTRFLDASGGKYLSLNSAVFDTAGAAMCKVIVSTAASSGTADIWAEVY